MQVKSNTYNKAKEKSNKLVKSKAESVSQSSVVVGRTQTTAKGRSTANTKQAVVNKNTTTTAVKRREKLHTRPEAITTRIPKWLGFDAKEKFETIAVSTANRYPLVMGVAITLLITVMFMMVVINAVNINKVKTETTYMNVTLAELIEKEAELSLELEKRDDLRYIREIALNQYGMIDKKHVTKHYISLDRTHKVELADNSASEPLVDSAKD